MSFAQNLTTSKDAPEDVIFPPGDLWSDEPPLESDFHRKQIEILLSSIENWFRERQDFYASGNLTIYYSPNQRKSEDFRGPDFFVVLGAERRERRSWVVWQEGGRYPNVIVEILSDTTAAVDRGLKKQIYGEIFRTPEYFWFDPETLEFRGFQLVGGEYLELQLNSQGWLWSQQLGLYLGVHSSKLRFFNPEGELVSIPDEIAEQERQQREQVEQQVELERQQREQAEALLARYREQFGELPE
jgi:Uma2 family endonuclease